MSLTWAPIHRPGRQRRPRCRFQNTVRICLKGIEEPIIQRIDFVGGPFVTYTVESEQLPAAELSWVVDNDIARSLLSVPGVGQVQRAGGLDREIRVKLNPTRLEAVGITADTVNTQLRLLNINLPGGRGDIGKGEQSIRFLGSAETVRDLAKTDIILPSGKHARLETLGTVEDSTSDVRQTALLNNKNVVAFSVVRSNGSNLVDVEKGVDKKIKELEASVSGHIKIVKIRSNSRYIKMSYDASFESLVVGALLAVIVVFVFLKDIRATALTALAIPLSVVPTFAVMDFAGFTLNGMSLLGLALVIGILVDDAIVEIENIVRHLRMGKTPYRAAIEAAEEIGLAVIATTMSIVVVFVPVAANGRHSRTILQTIRLDRNCGCALFAFSRSYGNSHGCRIFYEGYRPRRRAWRRSFYALLRTDLKLGSGTPPDCGRGRLYSFCRQYRSF